MSLIPRIRVLCVDDHEFLIEGLAARMSLEPDLEYVGRLPTADDLVTKAKECRADVVLLDLGMPGSDPLERLVDLKRALPDVEVVILSAHVRDRYIDVALERGASGYFSKSDTPVAIFEGIRRAMSGRLALSDEVAGRLRDGSRAGVTRGSGSEKGRSRLSMLSPRELEVLRLVGRGMSRAQIAREFCRSLKTIDAQHTSIMKKLDIHDRAELTRFAIVEGVVEA
ncbi:MAG: response regulator transcription factor [Phycisphaerae bacterium]|nr:response regulator transcription factor [Phycisphaerae bacterium]